jgi:hypothetical protein
MEITEPGGRKLGDINFDGVVDISEPFVDPPFVDPPFVDPPFVDPSILPIRKIRKIVETHN